MEHALRSSRRRGWLVSLGLAMALLAGVLAAAVLAIDGAPRVAARDDVSTEDVARAVSLMQRHDPRALPAAGLRTVRLTTRDIELLLNHAAHRIVRARVAVVLDAGAARLDASVPLAAGRWANLRSRWVETGGVPRLDSLAVGALPLPAWAGDRIWQWLARRSGLAGQADPAEGVLQRVSLQPDALWLIYRSDGTARRHVMDAFVPAREQQRLHDYAAQLARLTRQRPAGSTWPVSQALTALAGFARERVEGGADATLETRAALLVFTAYANGRALGEWLPAARGWPHPAWLRVTLDGRADHALHFLVSALVAIDGTSVLSRAVGVYKEVEDSRGGSGFSFDDLVADRAGTRFGELALVRPRELLRRLAGSEGELPSDRDLMPPWRDLPGSMPEAEFVRRYGGVGAPAYERVLAEIDRRVAALPLLR